MPTIRNCLTLIWGGLCFVLISGAVQAAGSQPSINDFLIEPVNLPRTCQFEKAPGDGFFCPFNQNPYVSKDNKFVGCMQNMIGLKQLPTARSALLQAIYDTQAIGQQEVGLYVFEMQSDSDAKAALAVLKPQQESSDLLVQTQGPFLFWLWNDVEQSSLCYQAVREHLQKKGLALDDTLEQGRETLWGGWSVGSKTR